MMRVCPECLHGDSACKQPNYVDELRGFDMEKFKSTESDLTLWKLVDIHKTVGSHNDYAWEDVCDILASMENFDSVEAYMFIRMLCLFLISISMMCCLKQTEIIWTWLLCIINHQMHRKVMYLVK